MRGLNGSVRTTSNTAGLPIQIDHPTHSETLSWDRSGKLTNHQSEYREQTFSYSSRGRLLNALSEDRITSAPFDEMGQIF